jgi:hypothetical protein
MQSLEQAVGAAVGGGIATFALYPLDNLRTKLAVSTDADSSALKTVQKVLRTEGVLGLFKGVPMKLIQVKREVFFFPFLFSSLFSFFSSPCWGSFCTFYGTRR